MGTDIRIRTWLRASAAEEQTGLLGYLSVYYGELVIDGVTLRRTLDGRLALSFPARSDRRGKRHPYIQPIDDAARSRIEAEVLGELARRQEVES